MKENYHINTKFSYIYMVKAIMFHQFMFSLSLSLIYRYNIHLKLGCITFLIYHAWCVQPTCIISSDTNSSLYQQTHMEMVGKWWFFCCCKKILLKPLKVCRMAWVFILEFNRKGWTRIKKDNERTKKSLTKKIRWMILFLLICRRFNFWAFWNPGNC